MTNVNTLLDEIKHLGIELRACGDTLRFRPQDAVDQKLRERLTLFKGELLNHLRANTSSHHRLYEVPEGWTREAWIKRLRYLADNCMHASRSAELSEWATGLENETKER